MGGKDWIFFGLRYNTLCDIYLASYRPATAVVVEERELDDDASDMRAAPPEDESTPMLSSPTPYSRQPSTSHFLTPTKPLR